MSNTLFYPDFDFDHTDGGIEDGDSVHCLKLIGLTQSTHTDNGEYLLYLVLRALSVSDQQEPKLNEDTTFERIALLRDTRGSDDVRLEDGSDEGTIKRDAFVKIV